MIAKEISLEKAKQDKLFYVVANVVVYRKTDSTCLILKRDEREIAHPGRYGVIGGKMEWQDMPVNKPDHVNGDVLDYEDMIEKLLIREAKEEAGIEIFPYFKYINSKTFIRPDGIPVVLIKFTAQYKTGEVVLEKGAFTDYAWVNRETVLHYDCIDGIKEEIMQSIEAWKK